MKKHINMYKDQNLSQTKLDSQTKEPDGMPRILNIKIKLIFTTDKEH